MSKRDKYVEKLKAQIDEWNADLDQLEAKAKRASGDIKLKYEEQVEHLRAKQNEMKDKLAELQKASEEAWENLRAGIDEAGDVLKEAFQKAKESFK